MIKNHKTFQEFMEIDASVHNKTLMLLKNA